MDRRMVSIYEEVVPALDRKDILNSEGGEPRQAAPIYSQSCYLVMLAKEKIIGNYISYSESQLVGEG